MMMSKKFFIISHNEFANGLKAALEMIAGPQNNLYAWGLMPGTHPNQIIAEVKEAMTKEDEIVILGDMAGGSLCNAAMPLTLLPNVTMVVGVNLPMAMEIILMQCTKKEEIDLILKNARKGMQILELKLEESENMELFD